MNWKTSGYIVKTKNGKVGRTFNGKGLINGKLPVYLAMEMSKEVHGFSIPIKYAEQAILCDPATLTQIGFID